MRWLLAVITLAAAAQADSPTYAPSRLGETSGAMGNCPCQTAISIKRLPDDFVGKYEAPSLSDAEQGK